MLTEYEPTISNHLSDELWKGNLIFDQKGNNMELDAVMRKYTWQVMK